MPPRKKKEPRPDGSLVAVAEADEERAYQAYWLRTEHSLSWAQVAAQMEYPSEDAARVAVRAYLQRAALEVSARRRRQVLEHEVGLFDQIEVVLLPRVLDGDLKAMETLMKASMNRARLQGLLDTNAEKGTTNTVVVTPERFVETMKAVALGQHPAQQLEAG
jgi:hypothetical protein